MKRCDDAGDVLATFILRLEKEKQASRQRMHVIGHSLGGQVCILLRQHQYNTLPTYINIKDKHSFLVIGCWICWLKATVTKDSQNYRFRHKWYWL